MEPIALLVIAKQPLPGRAKTRLTPPCSADQAAQLAGASLLDTLDVVARTPSARRILVFEGDADGWLPAGFELIRQRGDDLAERLGAAFDDAAGPALLVGMDTPQLTPALLLGAIEALSEPGVDAVLGPAVDGGYWSLGLRSAEPGAFAGVPMSSGSTCISQRARLNELGLCTREQPLLRDVDTIDDAWAVAAQAPDTHFARAMSTI